MNNTIKNIITINQFKYSLCRSYSNIVNSNLKKQNLNKTVYIYSSKIEKLSFSSSLPSSLYVNSFNSIKRYLTAKVEISSIDKIELLKKNASLGDINSIAELGKYLLDDYDNNIIINKEDNNNNNNNNTEDIELNNSIKEARLWLEIAAEHGNLESQFLLGVTLIKQGEQSSVIKEATTSEEVKQQIKDARKASRLRVKETRKKERLERLNSNNNNSKIILSNNVNASISSSSIIIDKSINIDEKQELNDNSIGMKWLKSSAGAGYGRSMCYLGNQLLLLNTSNSINEALLWYNRAIKLPNPQPDVLFNLGSLYFEGKENIIDIDLNKSLNYFEKSADLGDISGQFWVGHCYMSGEGGVGTLIDPIKAVKYLEKAANGGHPSAHYYLSSLYRSGLSSSVNSIPPNEDLFLHHLQLAIELNDEDGIFCMADIYMHGLVGYDVNILKAKELYEQASNNGHVEATLCLGTIYYNGLEDIVEVDRRKAFELYNIAAEGGSQDAWKNLAGMYYIGDGVPKSEETARNIMKVIFGKDDTTKINNK
jgi:TPR repeat protein